MIPCTQLWDRYCEKGSASLSVHRELADKNMVENGMRCTVIQIDICSCLVGRKRLSDLSSHG